MNLCKNCKYYRRSLKDWILRKPARCGHYDVVNPVNGMPVKHCETQRAMSYVDCCGPMGKYFVPINNGYPDEPMPEPATERNVNVK